MGFNVQQKKTGPIIAVVIIVIAAIAAVAYFATRPKTSNTTNPPRQTDQPVSGETSPNAVTIQNMSFAPAAVTVKKGTAVTWTNQDSIQHNVLSDDGSVNGPSGPLLSKGEQYSFTFNTAGTFHYHCGVHPSMHGMVTVTE